MKYLSVFFIAVTSIFLTSCGQGDVLRVDEAVINLSPVDGNPASGYLTVHGGPNDVDLLSVTADDAIRVEMHETVEDNGMASMQMIKKVPIPAGDIVTFEPGGKHLMIWGVGGGSIHRGTLSLVFIFSNDDRIAFDAVIRKVGDPAPTEK